MIQYKFSSWRLFNNVCVSDVSYVFWGNMFNPKNEANANHIEIELALVVILISLGT